MYKVHGQYPDEESTFYELKAYVENILRRIGIAQGLLVSEKSDNNVFDKAIVLKTRAGKVLKRWVFLATSF